MNVIVYNVTTAALLVMTAVCGGALVGWDDNGIRGRRIPWVAITLTALVVVGLVVQLTWSGAMDALDKDPARPGWWRVITSVFMQNGGPWGDAWNVGTILVITALAEWFWGRTLTVVLFVAAILLPHHIDTLLGLANGPVEPRNFAGSSGATYFLGATLVAPRLTRTRELKEWLPGVGAVVLGLAIWFAQDNTHGLVWVYGFVVGAVVWALGHKLIRTDARV
jgi:hypothetical protein